MQTVPADLAQLRACARADGEGVDPASIARGRTQKIADERDRAVRVGTERRRTEAIGFEREQTGGRRVRRIGHGLRTLFRCRHSAVDCCYLGLHWLGGSRVRDNRIRHDGFGHDRFRDDPVEQCRFGDRHVAVDRSGLGGTRGLGDRGDQGDVKLDRNSSTNILELIPFFEVQTTYLNDWRKEYGGSNEFSLTNDPVSTSDANGPTHSRGLVTNRPTDGWDMVHTIVNRGVTGVTSSDPINGFDTDGDPGNGLANVLPQGTVWPPGDIEVNTGVNSPTFDGRVIMGTLSSEVPGLKAANVSVTATDAMCDYETTTGVFTCFIPTGAGAPTLTVSEFDKPPKTIYICSSHQFGSPAAELPVDSPTSPGAPRDVNLLNALAVPLSPATPYLLWLTEDACPAGDGDF